MRGQRPHSRDKPGPLRTDTEPSTNTFLSGKTSARRAPALSADKRAPSVAGCARRVPRGRQETESPGEWRNEGLLLLSDLLLVWFLFFPLFTLTYDYV